MSADELDQRPAAKSPGPCRNSGEAPLHTTRRTRALLLRAPALLAAVALTLALAGSAVAVGLSQPSAGGSAGHADMVRMETFRSVAIFRNLDQSLERRDERLPVQQ